jgi:hypothetical protein
MQIYFESFPKGMENLHSFQYDNVIIVNINYSGGVCALLCMPQSPKETH